MAPSFINTTAAPRYFHIWYHKLFHCSGHCSSIKLKLFWDGFAGFTRLPSIAQIKVKTPTRLSVYFDSLYPLHDSIPRRCPSRNILGSFMTSCLDLISLFRDLHHCWKMPLQMFLEEKLDEVFPDVTRQNFEYISFVLWKLVVHSSSSVFSTFYLESVCTTTRMSPEIKTTFFSSPDFWYNNFHTADT